MAAATQAPAIGAPVLRPVTGEAFDAVKAELSQDALLQCDDAMIRRFIRASDGKVPVAIKRINATLEWRCEHRPDEMYCSACRADPAAHYMHVVGFCRHQRPVMYSCLQLAKNKAVEDNRQHMIQTFERAVRMMPAGVEQWIWVSDFHGFGMADLNPAIAKTFLEMTASHYPERLGVFVCVAAPRMFTALWKCIAPLVDPVTKAKLRFIPYDLDDKKTQGSVLRGELLQLFDEELTEWLLNEMRENRNKKVNATKTYSYDDLAKMAAEGCVDQPGSSADSSSSAGSHDRRGTTRFLQAVLAQPQLLVPQVAAVAAGQALGQPGVVAAT